MTVLDEPGLFSARWDPALRAIRMHWASHGDPSRLRPGLERLLEALAAHRAVALLFDLTEVDRSSSEADMAWLLEDWLPRLLEAGSLRAVVTVSPRAPEPQGRLRAYRAALGERLAFANVGSVAEAEAWLRGRGLGG